MACEGTKTDPVPESRVETRKKQLQDCQRKQYFDGIEDNDPRFNLVGGTFKGAVTLRQNLATLNLPGQHADLKRLKQRDIFGKNFEQRIGAIDQRAFSSIADIKTDS